MTCVVICFHFTIFVVLETTWASLTAWEKLLWFAFILLSLSYWKQHWDIWLTITSCCDLLSFYYLCRTGNNFYIRRSRRTRVVICFHFTIFVVLETTKLHHFGWSDGLWFAFILLSLSYWKQLLKGYLVIIRVVICFHFTIFVVLETTDQDNHQANQSLWFAFILLSLSYWKQQALNLLILRLVVICFHFTIFVVLETTEGDTYTNPKGLWFAFILLSLSYWKQPESNFLSWPSGCDLLSFYYLCRTGNNRTIFLPFAPWVVICFHFTIFVVLETTGVIIQERKGGCDLLSFYYLCRTGNNYIFYVYSFFPVVICFHFTIFVVLETTNTVGKLYAPLLWFAFILLSLSYWKQRIVRLFWKEPVVICFHFTIFVVLETTYSLYRSRISLLWFAFILLSLSYWKQHFEHYQRQTHVVICFHFTIFVVLETTHAFASEPERQLWFAFILLSLSYWKQPKRPSTPNISGCDLLSFYYLCRTGNNLERISIG